MWTSSDDVRNCKAVLFLDDFIGPKNDFRTVSLAVLGGINLRMPEAYQRTIVRALAIISS
jgi:hypothetical protein